jgi:shikimate kinase
MGFMGSGKSLLGRSLAKLLKRPFIDLDQYIEEQEMLSIGEIFETQGEKHFRELEEKYLKKVLESDSEAVIALGGGTPFHPSSFDLIKKKSLSLYLKVSLEQLIIRLSLDSANRPLLRALSQDQIRAAVSQLFAARESTYLKADVFVNAEELKEDIWIDLLPEIQRYHK